MKRLILILICLVPTFLWAQNHSQHVVKAGETMYGIARTYGVTMEALESANPNVHDYVIQVGQVLNIPAPPAGIVPDRGTADGTLHGSAKTLRVGVMMPLLDTSDRAKRYLEFYRGLLMAADSVRREGGRLEVYGWNYATDDTLQDLYAAHPQMGSLDVIFGPTENAQIPALAEFCRTHNIRLVIPFSHSYDFSGNPNVYSATATQEVVALSAAELMYRAKPNRNFVIMMSNVGDVRGLQFTDAVREVLKAKGLSVNIVNINCDEMALQSVLQPNMENCILVDNTTSAILDKMVARLRSFKQNHPNYTFSLQGYPEWQGFASKYKNTLHEFDTYTYCTYYRFADSPRVQHFEERYKSFFRSPMRKALPQLGLQGFDLGYYFMHGLSVLGSSFDVAQGSMKCDPLQHIFLFEKVCEGGGYTNQAIQLIHYTPQHNLERITP